MRVEDLVWFLVSAWAYLVEANTTQIKSNPGGTGAFPCLGVLQDCLADEREIVCGVQQL